MKSIGTFLAFLVGLGFAGTSVAWASNSSDTSLNSRNNDPYTTSPIDSAARSDARAKRYTPRKSTKKSAPASKTIPATGSADQAPITPPTAGALGTPSVPGNIHGNDAGMSNKGSGDHTPGTTGTSGQ